jgi:hypothetical protein
MIGCDDCSGCDERGENQEAGEVVVHQQGNYWQGEESYCEDEAAPKDAAAAIYIDC